MSLTWIVVLTTILACVALSELSRNSLMKITVNFMKMCPEHLNVPSTYDNLTTILDPETDILYLSGILNMKEPIPQTADLSMDFRKCYNDEESSCEKYIVTEVQSFCSHLGEQNKTWTEFVNHLIDFKPECPMKPGSYVMNEAPIDFSAYENNTEFVGHWQVELAFVDKRTMLGCLLADMTITRRRNG